MKGLVVKVGPLKQSLRGGQYKRSWIKNIDQNSKGEIYIFDCYLNHTMSSRFFQYLKPQAILDHLSLIVWNGKSVINGNGNFTYVGQRHY